MWFAALQDPGRLVWFSRFLQRLLQNEPAVTALLEKNPFPDTPPVYVRALFYRYNYADSNEKAEGAWWERKLLGGGIGPPLDRSKVQDILRHTVLCAWPLLTLALRPFDCGNVF